jgi:hypothetical protein
MSTLADILLAQPHRESVITDCVKLVERQVESHGPMRRLALKAGLAMLNSLRPNALHSGISKLLPDFTTALEPLYQKFRSSGEADFSQFLARHSDTAVQALLGVSDLRAGSHGNATVRAAYGRLRPTAESEVRSALPGLGRIVAAYLG